MIERNDDDWRHRDNWTFASAVRMRKARADLLAFDACARSAFGDDRGARLANAGLLERYLQADLVLPDCRQRAIDTIRNLEAAP